jgi:hypothetical protein
MGCIKTYGSWFLEPLFDVLIPSEGFTGVKLNGKWGFIRTDGSWLTSDFSQTIKDFLHFIKLDGGWLLEPFLYDEILDISDIKFGYQKESLYTGSLRIAKLKHLLECKDMTDMILKTLYTSIQIL